MRISFLILSLLLFPRAAVVGQDSLLVTFNNTSLSDSIRLTAIHKYARQFMSRHPDSTFYYAEIEYAMAQESGDSGMVAAALNLMGGSLWVQGEFADAMDHFYRNLEVRMAIKDTIGAAAAYNNIGNIYYTMGDNSRALNYYIKSLELEELKGNDEGLASAYLNLGSIYAGQKDVDMALLYFNRAKVVYEKLNIRNELGSSYHNIGIALGEKGELESAKENFERAIEIFTETANQMGLSTAYLNIADVYRRTGMNEEALAFYDQSMLLRRQIGDKVGISRVLINKGLSLLSMERYEEAKEICLEGYEQAETLSAIREMRDACDCLYQVNKISGRNEIALRYFEEYTNYDDSLRNSDISRQLQQMEFKKQVAKDSLQREMEKQEMTQSHFDSLKKASRARNIMMFSGLALLLFSGILYRRIQQVRKSKQKIEDEKSKGDKLLLSVLPQPVARELIEKGKVVAREFQQVSVLFTDFIDFTHAAENMRPQELVDVLNLIFQEFDTIVRKFGVEKIKTIGDAYMAAGGLPVSSPETIRNTVLAAIEMQEYLEQRRKNRESKGLSGFRMRAGINTGNVIAGIVGKHNFQYDIYGDAVNMASRLEQMGSGGVVNISETTYLLIKDDPIFDFDYRGKFPVKGKGETAMWFVRRR